MACAQSISGYTYDNCFSSKGGVKALWIAPYNASGFSLANELISLSATASFKKYEVRRETSSMESTATIDSTTGANYVETDANLVFVKMTAESRLEANALLKGEFMAVVKDANDTYHFLGYNEPVYASAGSASTGTARGDSNNYTVTLHDIADNYPYHLDATSASALEAL